MRDSICRIAWRSVTSSSFMSRRTPFSDSFISRRTKANVPLNKGNILFGRQVRIDYRVQGLGLNLGLLFGKAASFNFLA